MRKLERTRSKLDINICLRYLQQSEKHTLFIVKPMKEEDFFSKKLKLTEKKK